MGLKPFEARDTKRLMTWPGISGDLESHEGEAECLPAP